MTIFPSRPSPAVGIRRHGHANVGMELARENHSPGNRGEWKRAEGAVAACAELDIDSARDAPAAVAYGGALFDARRGLARVWRGAAPASRLDARRLCRVSGLRSELGDAASPRHH